MKRVKQSLDARVICTIIRCDAPKLDAVYSCAKMDGNNIIAKALLSFLIQKTKMETHREHLINKKCA